MELARKAVKQVQRIQRASNFRLFFTDLTTNALPDRYPTASAARTAGKPITYCRSSKPAHCYPPQKWMLTSLCLRAGKREQPSAAFNNLKSGAAETIRVRRRRLGFRYAINLATCRQFGSGCDSQPVTRHQAIHRLWDRAPCAYNAATHVHAPCETVLNPPAYQSDEDTRCRENIPSSSTVTPPFRLVDQFGLRPGSGCRRLTTPFAPLFCHAPFVHPAKTADDLRTDFALLARSICSVHAAIMPLPSHATVSPPALPVCGLA